MVSHSLPYLKPQAGRNLQKLQIFTHTTCRPMQTPKSLVHKAAMLYSLGKRKLRTLSEYYSSIIWIFGEIIEHSAKQLFVALI